MKSVLVLSNNNKYGELLCKELCKQNYSKSILFRHGSLAPVKDIYSIEINQPKALAYALDKKLFKDTCKNKGIATLPYSLDLDFNYPFVLKSRYKKDNRSNCLLIESKADFNTCISTMLNGWYVEPIFYSTSEYRLFCTADDVFYAVKKYKIDSEDIVVDKYGYVTKPLVKGGGLLFPRLWSKMRKDVLTLMKYYGLDIAAFDIGYDAKCEGHRYVLHKINPNPELTPDVLTHYVQQINNIVKIEL